jgi:hypothetical protein
MAKKVFKNWFNLLQQAETFHELLGIVIERTTNSLNYNKREAMKKTEIALMRRSEYLDEIKSDESKLKRYEARRLRFEKYQSDKRIPAKLRKEIAKLETHLLRFEHTTIGGLRCSPLRPKLDLAKLFKEVDEIKNPPKPPSTVNKDFKVGKSYLGTSITKAYDSDVWDVLEDHFECVSNFNEKLRYKIVAALPEKDEYLQLKERHFTISLETLVDKAYWMLEDLEDDLESDYEVVTGEYEEEEDEEDDDEYEEDEDTVVEDLSTAIGQIESINGYYLIHPDSVSNISLVRYPSKGVNCHADKAEDVADMLEMALQAIQKHVASGIDLNEDDAAEFEEYKLLLEEHIGELRSIYFPDLDERLATIEKLMMME